MMCWNAETQGRGPCVHARLGQHKVITVNPLKVYQASRRAEPVKSSPEECMRNG